MHDRLKHMKETLMCAVEMQLCNLGEVDTEELGEAIDMIKDLEEAIYYCTVTEAMSHSKPEMEFEMKEGGEQQHYREGGGGNRRYYEGSRSYRPYNEDQMMYAEGNRRRRADGTFYAEAGGRNYSEGGSSYRDGGNSSSYRDGGSSSSYQDSGMSYSDGTMWRDEREGRSYNNRRMYMEAKDMKKDKATQLRELEKYMQELSTDITEMISDASADEKSYLEKKISALAAKIGQMK